MLQFLTPREPGPAVTRRACARSTPSCSTSPSARSDAPRRARARTRPGPKTKSSGVTESRKARNSSGSRSARGGCLRLRRSRRRGVALDLDRRLLDDVVGGEDRRVAADGERDRVARPRVDLDVAAVPRERDPRVERVLAQLRDGDPDDLGPSSPSTSSEQVVRHRPGQLFALELGGSQPPRDGRSRSAGTACRRPSSAARSAACRPCRSDAVDDHLAHPQGPTLQCSHPLNDLIGQSWSRSETGTRITSPVSTSSTRPAGRAFPSGPGHAARSAFPHG